MWKLIDNVDLKKIKKFGYSEIPEGIYAKSVDCYVDGMGDRHEKFIAVEKDRTINKYYVLSYLFKVYEEKRLHLWRRDIKDLIQAGLVEKIDN